MQQRQLVKALNGLARVDLPHRLKPSPCWAAELARYMEREVDNWGKAVKQAGIKAP